MSIVYSHNEYSRGIPCVAHTFRLSVCNVYPQFFLYFPKGVNLQNPKSDPQSHVRL